MKKHELLEKAMRDYPAGTVARFGGKAPDHTSNGKFQITDLNHNGDIQVMSDNGSDCFYADGEWAIPVKDSILSEKCAIQVNNEREFKLLMEHRAYHGWDVFNIQDGDAKAPNPIIVRHTKKPVFLEEGCDKGFGTEGYKIIPFQDFAAEAGIEVPVFAMTSEDNVPLYVGDKYSHAYYSDVSAKWMLGISNSVFSNDSKAVSTPDQVKAFSTKEAAEKWIEQTNIPQQIRIEGDGGYAIVTKDKLTLHSTGKYGPRQGVFIDKEDLVKVFEAYQSLTSC